MMKVFWSYWHLAFLVVPALIFHSIRFQPFGDASLSIFTNAKPNTSISTAPVAWQAMGERRVGSRLGSYDSTLPLATDPTYSWHAFWGTQSWVAAIERDASGNIFLVGYANAGWTGADMRYPFDSGETRNIVVVKLNSAGVYQWHAFYGAGSTDARGISLDPDGNIYITGLSDSGNWGIAAEKIINSYSSGTQGYVFKIDAEGTPQWLTFYGGPQLSFGYKILWANGALYGIGSSFGPWGSPLNPHSGLVPPQVTWNPDVVIFKMDVDGHLVWHTFYGALYESSGLYATDRGYDIALDASGNIFVTGDADAAWTVPGNIPPVNPVADVGDFFVMKLTNNGDYQWHTYMGTSNRPEQGYGIVIDEDGNVYVTGSGDGLSGCGSPMHASMSAGYNSLLVAKLNPSGVCQWYTMYGDTTTTYGKNIEMMPNGDLLIVGNSNGAWGGDGGHAPLHAFTGTRNSFILKVDRDGNYDWHTFYGNSEPLPNVDIALDLTGGALLTSTSSSSWTVPGADLRNPFSGTSENMSVLRLIVNESPSLDSISSLSGAIQSTPFSISYDDLLGAVMGMSDPDGDTLSFRIESVISGVLTKGGAPVAPGVTTLAMGESLVWTSAPDAGGLTNAFTITAYDGWLASGALTVKVNVAADTYSDPARICGGHAPCFTSLQAALNAVADGYTVTVYPGTYNESVTFNKPVAVTCTGDVAITGSVNLTDGILNAPAGKFAIGGNFTQSGGTFNPNGGTLVVSGQNKQITLTEQVHHMVVDNGQLGYWKLDDGTHQAADSSGKGHTGALTNFSPYPYGPGVPTNFPNPAGLQFDRSSNTFVRIADSSDLHPRVFSISLWVYYADPGHDDPQFLIAKGFEHYEIHLGGAGVGRNGVRFTPAGFAASGVTAENALWSEYWNHIAVTYDGSTARMYVRGSLVAEKTGITGAADLSLDGSDLLLGRRGDGSFPLGFALDDVRLYGRVLAADEIATLAGFNDLFTNVTLGAPLIVAGNLALQSGTLDVSSGNCSDGPCDIALSGNWYNTGGGFNPRTGRVDLNGVEQAITGVNTFYELRKNNFYAGGTALTLPAGQPQTFLGPLTLQGIGATLTLRSSNPGMQWQIDPRGPRYFDALDITDGKNLHTVTMNLVGHNCTDSGNNAGFNFYAPVADAKSVQVADHNDITITLTGSDGDGTPLTAWVVTQPTLGRLFQYDASGRGVEILSFPAQVTDSQWRLIYAPTELDDGSDSFRVRLNDGMENSAEAVVSITASQPPTVSLVHDLMAVSTPGGIIVSWAAYDTLEVVGFNVYRGRAESGAFVQLNSNLIAAQHPIGSGPEAEYMWVDTNVGGDIVYQYRLEIVLASGERKWSEFLTVHSAQSWLHLPYIITR